MADDDEPDLYEQEIRARGSAGKSSGGFGRWLWWQISDMFLPEKFGIVTILVLLVLLTCLGGVLVGAWIFGSALFHQAYDYHPRMQQ